MYNSNSNLPAILSQRVKLHWAGWESDTAKLQQAGWQLSAMQDPGWNRMQLALKHEDYGIRMLTELDEDFNYVASRMDGAQYLRDRGLRVIRAGSDLRVRALPPMDICSFEKWNPIDARPMLSYMGEPMQTLDDLAHFAAPLVRTKQIILPEPTVDELLERILEKQQAAKVEYFREQVEQERYQPQQKFHAQIISFASRRAA